MNGKNLTEILEKTNGDIKAVSEYFSIKRKAKSSCIPVPICVESVLQILDNKLRTNRDQLKRSVSLVTVCLTEYASYQQNDHFWDPAAAEVVCLLEQCLRYLAADTDISSLKILKRFCALVIKICQKSNLSSSLIFQKCSGPMLALLLRKDLRPDLISDILDILNIAGEKTDASTVYVTCETLQVHLRYLAKMIYDLSYEDQIAIFSILKRSVKESGEARLKALMWFPKYPDLQCTFLDARTKPDSVANSLFVNRLCKVNDSIRTGKNLSDISNSCTPTSHVLRMNVTEHQKTNANPAQDRTVFGNQKLPTGALSSKSSSNKCGSQLSENQLANSVSKPQTIEELYRKNVLDQRKAQSKPRKSLSLKKKVTNKPELSTGSNLDLKSDSAISAAGCFGEPDLKSTLMEKKMTAVLGSSNAIKISCSVVSTQAPFEILDKNNEGSNRTDVLPHPKKLNSLSLKIKSKADPSNQISDINKAVRIDESKILHSNAVTESKPKPDKVTTQTPAREKTEDHRRKVNFSHRQEKDFEKVQNWLATSHQASKQIQTTTDTVLGNYTCENSYDLSSKNSACMSVNGGQTSKERREVSTDFQCDLKRKKSLFCVNVGTSEKRTQYVPEVIVLDSQSNQSSSKTMTNKPTLTQGYSFSIRPSASLSVHCHNKETTCSTEMQSRHSLGNLVAGTVANSKNLLNIEKSSLSRVKNFDLYKAYQLQKNKYFDQPSRTNTLTQNCGPKMLSAGVSSIKESCVSEPNVEAKQVPRKLSCNRQIVNVTQKQQTSESSVNWVANSNSLFQKFGKENKIISEDTFGKPLREEKKENNKLGLQNTISKKYLNHVQTEIVSSCARTSGCTETYFGESSDNDSLCQKKKKRRMSVSSSKTNLNISSQDSCKPPRITAAPSGSHWSQKVDKLEKITKPKFKDLVTVYDGDDAWNDDSDKITLKKQKPTKTKKTVKDAPIWKTTDFRRFTSQRTEGNFTSQKADGNNNLKQSHVPHRNPTERGFTQRNSTLKDDILFVKPTYEDMCTQVRIKEGNNLQNHTFGNGQNLKQKKEGKLKIEKDEKYVSHVDQHKERPPGFNFHPSAHKAGKEKCDTVEGDSGILLSDEVSSPVTPKAVLTHSHCEVTIRKSMDTNDREQEEANCYSKKGFPDLTSLNESKRMHIDCHLNSAVSLNKNSIERQNRAKEKLKLIKKLAEEITVTTEDCVQAVDFGLEQSRFMDHELQEAILMLPMSPRPADDI